MAISDKGQVFDFRFAQFDANQDGRIERSDFEQEANRMLSAFGVDPNSPRAHMLRVSYVGVFDFIASQAGVKTDGSLSREQFVSASKAAITDRGGAGFADVLAPYAHACANLCDTDGDGVISQEEYTRWLTVIGAPAGNVTESYRAIDTNNDGRVSIDEFISAIRSYVLGESDIRMLG